MDDFFREAVKEYLDDGYEQDASEFVMGNYMAIYHMNSFSAGHIKDRIMAALYETLEGQDDFIENTHMILAQLSSHLANGTTLYIGYQQPEDW